MQSRIRRGICHLALPLALLAGSVALAQDHYPQFDLSLSALRDGNGGDSYDLSALLAPSARWDVALGGGSSRAADLAASPKGNSLHGSIDLHSSAVGLQSGYSRWSDSDNFEHAVPSLTAYWRRNGFRAEVTGEWPSFRVDYQVRVLTAPVTRRFEFSGNGFGGGIEYYGMRWGAYLRGVSYSYGSDIDRLRAAAQSPNLVDFPRLAALVGSMATLTRGALDSQLSTGLEYSFTRVTVHADLLHVEDALTGGAADSQSVGALVALNGRFSVDASIGISSADGFDSTGFGALTLSAHW